MESDTLPLGQQLALIRQMPLPCAAIVYSGGKSVHAIVHVDAATQKEYYERVAHMYDICNKNGFKVDEQNKNPSRLSRMPGVKRNGKKQFLIGHGSHGRRSSRMICRLSSRSIRSSMTRRL